MKTTKSNILFLLTLSLLSLSSCEYWWSRGQLPSVEKLVEDSITRLEQNESLYKESRPELLAHTKNIRSSIARLLNTVSSSKQNSELLKEMIVFRKLFMELEGKVSIGSRAALGELSGQLRNFVQDANNGKNLEYEPFGLFASRTMRFLSDELAVPKPNF